jgi:hypothetical protein
VSTPQQGRVLWFAKPPQNNRTIMTDKLQASPSSFPIFAFSYLAHFTG